MPETVGVSNTTLAQATVFVIRRVGLTTWRLRERGKIAPVSVWSNDWDSVDPEGRSRRLLRGTALGATLYELARGGGIAYHFHHGSEELLIVLHGRLTLRTPNGSRELGSGAVVHFPAGPEGAHAITKNDEEPVRYLMVSTLVSPDATEYPDTRQLSVYARTKNQFGEELFDIRTLDEP